MMNTERTPRRSNVRAALCALLLSTIPVWFACSGPERAPHQPIKGVDTEQNDVDNPHDTTTGR